MPYGMRNGRMTRCLRTASGLGPRGALEAEVSTRLLCPPVRVYRYLIGPREAYDLRTGVV